jgi:hypothetical protein
MERAIALQSCFVLVKVTHSLRFYVRLNFFERTLSSDAEIAPDQRSLNCSFGVVRQFLLHDDVKNGSHFAELSQ